MNAIARSAGALYLIVVVTGIFSLLYVPSQLTVQGDATATVDNIVAYIPLFRMGIAGLVLNQIAFVLLPFALHLLLRQVDRNISALMVALAVVSVPITITAIANRLDVLTLLGDASYLQAFTTAQLHAMVMLALRASSSGILGATIFWGLWLLPFGYLVFKSGFLPRILGLLLMLGGVSILIGVFGRMVVPGFAETAISIALDLPSAVGEIGICLWLLVWGVAPTDSFRRQAVERNQDKELG